MDPVDVSRTHHRAVVDDGSFNTDTIAILGCGALGTAILLGLLSRTPLVPDTTVNGTNGKANIPTSFIACVRRDQAADTIKNKLKHVASLDPSTVEFSIRNNVDSVRRANLVLIAVQPHMLADLFREPGMREALINKLIISVLAGVTVKTIQSELSYSPNDPARNLYIVRAMPNINCFAKQSTTVIEHGDFPQHVLDIVSCLFQCVGQVFFTEPSTMDACTALCGSTPAFFTVVLEGLIEGAIATGLKPDDALQMVAHAMMGTACLVAQRRETRAVRHEVTSPGGSTIQGVLTLEEHHTRWTFAKALQAACSGAARLGVEGRDALVKNNNGITE